MRSRIGILKPLRVRRRIGRLVPLEIRRRKGEVKKGGGEGQVKGRGGKEEG